MKIRRLQLQFLFVLMIILVASAAALSLDRSFRQYVMDPRGKIYSGSAFGVAVGNSYDSASATLISKNFIYAGLFCINDNSEKFYDANFKKVNFEECEKTILYFKDRGLMSSNISLSIHKRRVISIYWKYSFLNV